MGDRGFQPWLALYLICRHNKNTGWWKPKNTIKHTKIETKSQINACKAGSLPPGEEPGWGQKVVIWNGPSQVLTAK